MAIGKIEFVPVYLGGKLMKKIICLMSILVLGSLMVTNVFAGEQGHYSPAPMAVRDFVLPPKGTYFVNYNTNYDSIVNN